MSAERQRVDGFGRLEGGLRQAGDWYLLFNEYFHGDNGAGLGASHQTGWTGLIADLIRRRHGEVPPVGDIISGFTRRARP